MRRVHRKNNSGGKKKTDEAATTAESRAKSPQQTSTNMAQQQQQQPPQIPLVGSPPSALKELPALRDCPPAEREALFIQKLQLCGVIFFI